MNPQAELINKVKNDIKLMSLKSIENLNTLSVLLL